MPRAPRRVVAAALSLAASAALAGPATAAPTGAYDGSNPFDCELQQAGLGTTVPHPEADPFCVEYEKRRQNVTDLGVADFVSKEPARVALASNKCFYFQHDHWRGSIVQEDESTETYNWDGYYFFDKAKGTGGAYVENFTVNNQTGDPRDLPGFPEEYKPFYGPGRGGARADDTVDADPRCVAAAKAKDPYAKKGRGPGSPAKKPGACDGRSGEGSVGRSIGGIRLGMTRAAVEDKLGKPNRERRNFVEYCLGNRGTLQAGFPSARDSARTPFVATTSRGFAVKGVRRGMRSSSARRKLSGEKRLLRRGSYTVLSLARKKRRVLLGLRAGRVRYLAVASSRLTRRQLAGYLERSDLVRGPTSRRQ